MRNRRSINAISILVIAASGALIFFSLRFLPPRLDKQLPDAIGRALAREAIALLKPSGRIEIITRDTRAYPQPALDRLLKSFEREAAKSGAEISGTHMLQINPIRPAEVPSGDFYELIRRTPAGHVIVSLLGPPLLSEEEQSKLGRPQARIVAFCSADLIDNSRLRSLFDSGYLHCAILNRRGSQRGGATDEAASFDELYAVLKPGTFGALAETLRTRL